MDEANVSILLFAALRDAAGASTLTVPAPVTLTRLLSDLEQRFGSAFADRLALAAVLVDGAPADRTAALQLGPGTEVALLPPFAGGDGGEINPFEDLRTQLQR